MPVARHLLRPTRGFGRAALKHPSIWSCTGWGLPSFSGHPKNWCALTAPFHPYPAIAGRYIFCGTFLHVTATPRYGAPCSVVFGLSSGQHVSGDRLLQSDRKFPFLCPSGNICQSGQYINRSQCGHVFKLSPRWSSLNI